MTLTQHHVTFQRHRVTGQYKGQCTCGWFYVGERDEVTAKAAVHDLEWEAVEIREGADA
jgi:hypothetical protein